MSGGGVTLLYSGPVAAIALMRLPTTSAGISATLQVYDTNGMLLPAEASRSTSATLLLPRRSYALLDKASGIVRN